MIPEMLTIDIRTALLFKMLVLALLGFAVAMVLTPLYTTLAYRWKLWKKPRTETLTGETAKMFMKLHAEKHKRHIPTMAGLIFIVAIAAVTMCCNMVRSQTWLPLAALVGAGLIGLIDDIINIRGTGQGKAGLPSRLKFILISLVALAGGLYFYFKLDVSSIAIPGVAGGVVQLGWLIVPLFVLVVVSTANAVNISDGLDGLAGGLAAIAFTTYSVIAVIDGRYAVAGFCLTVVGALLSYTWFNIFPARFFMGDVGSFALGTALGVVAMITDTVLLLPLIGLVFVAEAGSVILQIASKKLRNGKKIFKVSPVHHHFEASGWPEAKVTMRFWVIAACASLLGLALFIIGKYAA